ncbi:MAG TPA: hypothetical protein VHD91_04465 [Gaiellaceae bacterium]|nr:hypothetical protein [Gaiellaceae bacterium]
MSVPATDLRRTERDAVIGGVAVGLAVALIALVGPILLFAIGVFSILLGVVFCLTVIGIVIGLPLILVGVVSIVGGAIGGSLGPVFALVLGAAAGLLTYEQRRRKVARG